MSSNPKLLAIALMASCYTPDLPELKWFEGEVLYLWNGQWTFSYHYGRVEGEGFIHYNTTLQSYWSKAQAQEAMGNFVRSLNAHWEE